MIERVGLERFTLRALSRELGVTHGAVYRHFDGKRAILVALSIEGHEGLAAALVQKSVASLEASLRRLSLAYLRWALSNAAKYEIMFGPRLNEDGAFPQLETAIEASFATVDRVFSAHGLSRKRARTSSLALMTQLHGFCSLVRLRRIRVQDQAATERLLKTTITPLVSGLSDLGETR